MVNAAPRSDGVELDVGDEGVCKSWVVILKWAEARQQRFGSEGVVGR